MKCKKCGKNCVRTSGRQKYCIDCRKIKLKEQASEDYQKHKTQRNLGIKKWRLKNKEKTKSYTKKGTKKKKVYDKKYREKYKDRIKLYQEGYYENNKQKIKKIQQKKYQINKNSIKQKIKKYKKKYPEKIKAHNIANRGIKIPEGQLCVICKKRLAKHKHHNDYDKPLEVLFVCVKCHWRLHNEKKTQYKHIN